MSKIQRQFELIPNKYLGVPFIKSKYEICEMFYFLLCIFMKCLFRTFSYIVEKNKKVPKPIFIEVESWQIVK